MDVPTLLRDLHWASVQNRNAELLSLKLQTAFWPWTRRKLMSALSDRIDAVNSTLTALDTQAPAAITAAIAAAAASGGTDTAAEASMTALEATVAKLTPDLQAAVGSAGTV